jgi:DNA-binding transcriptional MerR regulator
MPRPRKNNADYFPHPTADPPAVVYLVAKYGHTGYVFYYRMMEFLAGQDYFEAQLNDVTFATITQRTGIAIEEVKEMIKDTTSDSVKIFVQNKKNCLTSNELKKNLAPLLSSRKRDRKRKENKGKQEDGFPRVFREETRVFQSFPAQSKVKESKEKNSKEEKEKEKTNELRSQFDLFRKKYPGAKRGLDVEYEYFCKKNNDCKTVAPLLILELERQIEQRQKLRDGGRFVPEWPHLKTYLGNRGWELEYNNDTQESIEEQIKKQMRVSHANS